MKSNIKEYLSCYGLRVNRICTELFWVVYDTRTSPLFQKNYEKMLCRWYKIIKLQVFYQPQPFGEILTAI